MKPDQNQPVPVTPQPIAVAPVAPAQPAPVITPGAFGVPNNAPVPGPVNKKSKFNLPDFKELLAKLKTIPLKFKIMGGVVFFLIFLLILVSFTKGGKQVTQLILPSASPIPTTAPVENVFEPSPYANDPEVLELEKQVNEFDGKLSNTQLQEDTLRVPNLDWDINFKQGN